MPPNEFESRAQSASSEAIVLRYLNLRLNPELRFSFNVVDMHVRTEFLPREEEKPKTLLAEDGRAHEDILHPSGILVVTEIHDLDLYAVWRRFQTSSLSIGLTILALSRERREIQLTTSQNRCARLVGLLRSVRQPCGHRFFI